MRTLFTIHAGEYLVASHIEKHFKHVNLWLPSRDTGVDLMVSDARARKSVSLQVKFSKDFLVTHLPPGFQKPLRACGWWTIDRDKLKKSRADYWVFVLLGFASRSVDYVIIPPRGLWRRVRAIHGGRKRIHTYLWVTEGDTCWETRGLLKPDQLRIADGLYRHHARNLTQWLNNWSPVARLNR